MGLFGFHHFGVTFLVWTTSSANESLPMGWPPVMVVKYPSQIFASSFGLQFWINFHFSTTQVCRWIGPGGCKKIRLIPLYLIISLYLYRRPLFIRRVLSVSTWLFRLFRTLKNSVLFASSRLNKIFHHINRNFVLLRDAVGPCTRAYRETR